MARTRQITLETDQKDGQVDSLRRGLEILRLFNIRNRSLSISRIAEKLSLSRLTTEKLVGTLEAHNFLKAVGNDSYGPHISCLSLGQSVKRNLAIARAARPLMLELSKKFGVHITLTTRDRLHMLVVEHCVPEGKVRLGLTTGARFSIATSASGRAYLWRQAPEQRTRLMKQLETDTSPGAYRKLSDVYAAFEELNEHGWCYVNAPLANQSASVATPLHEHPEYALAAMAMGTEVSETTLLESIAPALLHVARQIDMQH